MTIYVSAPGQSATPVIVPDNATLAQFATKAQEVTGITNFNGFQYVGQGTVQTSPSESKITNANIYDKTSNAFVSLSSVAYNSTLSGIFTHGDSILLLNVPIGG